MTWLEDDFKEAPEPKTNPALYIPASLVWILGTLVGFALAWIASEHGLSWTLQNWFNERKGFEKGGGDVPLEGVFTVICAGCFSLLLATIFQYYVLAAPIGAEHEDEKHQAAGKKGLQINRDLTTGVNAFLTAKFKISVGFAFVFFLLVIFSDYYDQGWKTAICFLVGLIVSWLTSYMGSWSTVGAVTRAVHASNAQDISAGAAVIAGASRTLAFGSAGIALLALAILYIVFWDTKFLIGYALALNIDAIWTRVAGAIFARTAELNQSVNGGAADEPSPANLLGVTGVQAGDALGMSSDNIDSIIAAVLGSLLISHYAYGTRGLATPLYLVSIGLLGSLLGTLVMGAGVAPGTAAADAPASIVGKYRAAHIVSFLVNLAGCAIQAWVPNRDVTWPAFISFGLGALAALLFHIVNDIQTGKGQTDATLVETKNAPILSLIRTQRTAAKFVFVIGFIIAIFAVGAMLTGNDNTKRMLHAEFCLALLALGFVSSNVLHQYAQTYSAIADNASAVDAIVSEGSEEEERPCDAVHVGGGHLASTTHTLSVVASFLIAIVLTLVFAAWVLLKHRYMMTRNPFSLSAQNVVVTSGGDYVYREKGQMPFFMMDKLYHPGLMVNSLDKRSFTGFLIGAAFPLFYLSLFSRAVSGLFKSFGEHKEKFSADQATAASFGALKNTILPLLFAISMPMIIGFCAGTIMLVAMLLGASLATLVFGAFYGLTCGNWEQCALDAKTGTVAIAGDAVAAEEGAEEEGGQAADNSEKLGKDLKWTGGEDAAPAVVALAFNGRAGKAVAQVVGALIKTFTLVSLIVMFVVYNICDSEFIWRSFCYNHMPGWEHNEA